MFKNSQNYFGHPPVDGKVGGMTSSLVAFNESDCETLFTSKEVGVIIFDFSHDAKPKHPSKMKGSIFFIVLRF